MKKVKALLKQGKLLAPGSVEMAAVYLFMESHPGKRWDDYHAIVQRHFRDEVRRVVRALKRASVKVVFSKHQKHLHT